METSQHVPKSFTINTFDVPQPVLRFQSVYEWKRHNMHVRRLLSTHFTRLNLFSELNQYVNGDVTTYPHRVYYQYFLYHYLFSDLNQYMNGDVTTCLQRRSLSIHLMYYNLFSDLNQTSPHVPKTFTTDTFDIPQPLLRSHSVYKWRCHNIFPRAGGVVQWNSVCLPPLRFRVGFPLESKSGIYFGKG